METISQTPTAAIDPLKVQARAYIKKHNITPSKLALMAGIESRWVVGRWIREDSADIMAQTYKKIAACMAANP